MAISIPKGRAQVNLAPDKVDLPTYMELLENGVTAN